MIIIMIELLQIFEYDWTSYHRKLLMIDGYYYDWTSANTMHSLVRTIKNYMGVLVLHFKNIIPNTLSLV